MSEGEEPTTSSDLVALSETDRVALELFGIPASEVYGRVEWCADKLTTTKRASVRTDLQVSQLAWKARVRLMEATVAAGGLDNSDAMGVAVRQQGRIHTAAAKKNVAVLRSLGGGGEATAGDERWLTALDESWAQYNRRVDVLAKVLEKSGPLWAGRRRYRLANVKVHGRCKFDAYRRCVRPSEQGTVESANWNDTLVVRGRRIVMSPIDDNPYAIGARHLRKPWRVASPKAQRRLNQDFQLLMEKAGLSE